MKMSRNNEELDEWICANDKRLYFEKFSKRKTDNAIFQSNEYIVARNEKVALFKSIVPKEKIKNLFPFR